ncbi:MAG: hypothetical protein RQ862_00750 [Candidatus Caldarchaeales archaeon]|nr:hypothetical protein [Candidatus Caldarchaeales archaeon]
MEREGKILLQLSRILYLLYPRASKDGKLNNNTNYKRVLLKLGLKAYPIPNTRFILYDIASLNWEINGNFTVSDFVKDRSKFVTLREWVQSYKPPLNRALVRHLLKAKVLPYLKVKGAKKLIFVPANFDLTKMALERIKGEWEAFQQSLTKMAQGSIHAIVFPKWKKYNRRLQRIFRFLLAQQGRLLRVGKNYGVLVSTLDFTLHDLLEREGSIANLAYYIPTRSDQRAFAQAIEKGEITIVEPHEVSFPARDLIFLLVSSKPQTQS